MCGHVTWYLPCLVSLNLWPGQSPPIRLCHTNEGCPRLLCSAIISTCVLKQFPSAGGFRESCIPQAYLSPQIIYTRVAASEEVGYTLLDLDRKASPCRDNTKTPALWETSQRELLLSLRLLFHTCSSLAWLPCVLW